MLQGEVVKDDSGSYAVFTEQGSSASHMTPAKVLDVIARLLGWAGQPSDAVLAHIQLRREDPPYLLKRTHSECPDIRIRLPRHKWPKNVAKHSITCGYALKECVRTLRGWIALRETVQEGSAPKWMLERTNLGMRVCVSSAWSIPVSVRGRHRHGLVRSPIWRRCGKDRRDALVWWFLFSFLVQFAWEPPDVNECRTKVSTSINNCSKH